MSKSLLLGALLIATALAGCADEPAPIPPPSGLDGLTALGALQETAPAGTLLGVFAHSADTNRVPWPIGPVTLYEHMHLSGGGNRAMDRGTAEAWYAIQLEGAGAESKVSLTKIAGEITNERVFNAENFGWKFSWPSGDVAGDYTCGVKSSIGMDVGSEAAWSTANQNPEFAAFRDATGGQPIMLYLPSISSVGDECLTDQPLGFDFVQGNVWAVFLTQIDDFLQFGTFTQSVVAVIDASTGEVISVDEFEGSWGPTVLHSAHETFHSDLPGGPGLPQTFEVPFKVEEGTERLQVATRLLTGPAIRDPADATLTGPDGYTATFGTDHADWVVDAPAAGGWVVTYSFDQAQPNADYGIDVVALAFH